MAGRIVLFGATGYTGRLTAEAMVERGLRPVLAARSRDEARRAWPRELGGSSRPPTPTCPIPPSVGALVEEGDVLVTPSARSCAGARPRPPRPPRAGAHYIDSTGEPPFIREVFERYGAAAEKAGCAMLTAFG